MNEYEITETTDQELREYISKFKVIENIFDTASSVQELQDSLNKLLKTEGNWINLEEMAISEWDNTLKGNFYMNSIKGFEDYEKQPWYYVLKNEFMDISYGNWHRHWKLGECIQYYGCVSLAVAKGLSKVLSSLQEKRNNLADKLDKAKIEVIKQFSLDNEVSFKELKLLKDRVAFIEAYLQAALDTEREKLDNLYQQETKAIEVPGAFKRSITFDKPCILFTDLELK